ncbi:energy-coupling factor transporter transmembrane component T family protein [Desulfatirhabdium butyrativorans]|uniref:energy-coupling factor transporter transmembrane component T family protein n=1 Tax=Desulfatirhabdium butyrativorans TaxID=340467 RepID=UPI0003F9F7E2|nr:energy-coupling factor transporter transmembrane component T [Desulfatirhabdium butyrativorans]
MDLKLERLDPRVKWLGLIATGVVAAMLDVAGLSLLLAAILLILGLHSAGRQPPAWKGALPFWMTLLAVFLVRSIEWHVVSGSLKVSMQAASVLDGLRICLRLAILGLLGAWIALTTPMIQLKAAIEWALAPFHFIPGKSIATLLGLMVRFIPEIRVLAQETRQAQTARFMGHRPSILFRIRSFTAILIRRIMILADRLSDAMEARCFQEERTGYELRLNRIDRIAIAAQAILLSIAIGVDRLVHLF